MNPDHSEYPYSGLEDEQIYELCHAKREGYCLPLSSWSAEANWQGRATRYIAKLPPWLPLVYVSDHGVQVNTEFHDYEVNHNFGIFCTWNIFKYIEGRRRTDIRPSVRLISNPFALYWRCRGLRRRPDAKGTLVFLSHSGIGESFVELLTDEYVGQLESLPEKCHPIVLCIHRNDVLNGCLEKIRSVSTFPVLTMGFAGNPDFGDRFYNTISCFAYATSADEMSAMYYCVDFGVPFFLYGAKPTLAVKLTAAESSLGIGLKHSVYQLFKDISDHVTMEQKLFCEMIIGKSTYFDQIKFVTFVWLRLISFDSMKRCVRYLLNPLIKLVNNA